MFIAFTVLHRLLRNYHYKDVTAYLEQLPRYKQLLALGCTVCSYLLLTLYDTLGVRAIKHPLPYRRIALVSFIGYAFNNNFGFAGLAGNSMRYRIYTSWGLTALEVAKVIGFCVLAFWMGFFAVGGLSFLIDPVPIPAGLPLGISSLRPLGILFLLPVSIYLAWTAFRKEPIGVGKWKLRLPPLRISLAQVAVAALDWTFAALVFYCLLPAGGQISFPQLLGVFLLAQITGLVSHVPGGLGVFEAVVLLSLTPPHSVLAHPFVHPEIFAALVAYRGIYYLLPLGAAAVLLGSHELMRHSERADEIVQVISGWRPVEWFTRTVSSSAPWKALAAPVTTVRLMGEWAPSLVPNVFAFAVFLAGAILLFSGATPSLVERVSLLHALVPKSLVNTAHVLASVLGAALLLVAHGLYRRLDSAFVLTVILLAAGIPLSLLKGFDYEEAFILLVILLAFIPCRAHFYRKAALLTRFSIPPAWAVAIGLTVASSVWLGFFSYSHLHHKPQPAAHHILAMDHSRFLRASLGAVALLALYGLKVILRPARPPFTELGDQDWNTVRAIVAESPRTYAWLAMLRDKKIMLNSTRNAFIMYGIEGRSWVAMGDPVGPPEAKAELTWEFRELSDSHGGWATFYQVSPENLPLYLDLGLVLLKLGEEAIVPLDTFTIQGQRNKALRHTYHRLVGEGYRFEILSPGAARHVLPQLKEVSDAWLQAKSTPEKKFSLGYFDESYLLESPMSVVRDPKGRVAAFANLWTSAAKEELSVDMMRYVPDVNPGIMDYLFVALMLWGQAEGWKKFNLGVAPLAGLEGRALAPLWTRVGSLVFSHGEHFHHLRGLRQYKQKFDPVWTPTYLASPGGIALPIVVTNLAALISHGLRRIVAK